MGAMTPNFLLGVLGGEDAEERSSFLEPGERRAGGDAEVDARDVDKDDVRD